MNNFMLKRILSSFLSLSLLFSLVPVSATNSKNKDEKNQKTSSESLYSKTIKKIISHPKASISAAILAVLAAPIIYSNIKYSKPRDIEKVKGETDDEIVNHFTHDYNSSCLANKNEIESKIDEIIKEMNKHGFTNDYQKAIFLHDYIYKRCRFDMGRAIDFFANTNRFRGKGCHYESGCLLYNRAVCSGISRAYALLLNRAGVECKCISGVSYGMNHAWNIVKIGKYWYHVDLTWNLLFKAAHGKYAWFMRTDQEIRKDHSDYTSRVANII